MLQLDYEEVAGGEVDQRSLRRLRSRASCDTPDI